MPTPAYKLARLGPDERIFTIRREQERAERAEMKLAIWALAEGFGTLGTIVCAQCHTPAHLHELEPSEDGQIEMALYGVDRYYAGRCSNWPAR